MSPSVANAISHVGMAFIVGLAIAAPARAQSMETRLRISRSDVRLAIARTLAESVDAVQPDGTSLQSDWSRVMGLRKGTAVIVTVQDSPRVHREFVSADASTITLRPVSAINGPVAAVETTARSKVVEIRTTSRVAARGIRGALGAAGGFLGGALLGGMTGSLIGKAGGADPSNLRGIFWGTLAGGFAGAVFGATGSRVQEEVIYRSAGPD